MAVLHSCTCSLRFVYAVSQVTEGSIAACQLVCSQLLPKLVQVIKEPQQTHADSSTQHGAVLALGVLVKILQAARRLVTASSYQQDPLAGFGASVLAAVTHSATDATADQAASQAKTASAAEAAVQNESLMHLANAGSETADDDDEMTGNAAKLLQLHVLTELVSFPAELTVISQQVRLCKLACNWLWLAVAMRCTV